jgi:hypothetical protein
MSHYGGNMNLSEVPDGLAPTQYAMRICEDLGIPGKGNIQMIGEAIEAVSKSRLFRGRPDAIKVAYIWLSRRVDVAQQAGQKINNLWFMNGMYNEVEKPVTYAKPTRYEHHAEGYGAEDMLWLYERYQQKRKTLPNRQLTDAEINVLLDELDTKRGRKPAWRQANG